MRIPEGEHRATQERSLSKQGQPDSFALRFHQVLSTLSNRIAPVVGRVLFVVAISPGSGQGVGLVNAEATPICISTPTATATPNAIQKQIAELQATAVVLRKQKEDEQKLADARATVEALKATPTPTLPKTPPRSPAEVTATADAIRLKALGEEQARGKATATSQAGSTATAEGQIIATVQARQTATATTSRAAERNQDGGWVPGIILLSLTFLGPVGFLCRKRIANSRVGTWVKNKISRGGTP